MGYLVSFVFILIFLYFYIYKKEGFFSPICFFTLLWSVISLGACFCNRWGIPSVSEKTWIIIFIGVVGFAVGCFLGRYVRIKKNEIRTDYIDIKCETSINLKGVLLFFIITAPFLFLMLYEAILLIRNGWTLREIRSAYYGINGYDMYWNTSIYMRIGEKFFLSPFKVAIIPITIATCIREKPNLKLILIAVLIIITDSITTGGRFILLYVAVEIVAALAIVNRNGKIKKYVRNASIVLLIISLMGIIYITNKRGVYNNWINKIYEYFFCCIPLFDHYVPSMDTYTYGTASLNGILNPIISILSRFINISTPFERSIINDYNIQQAVQLSDTINTNAFVTSFFYTYLDFGLIGTFLGMMVFGIWSKKEYRFLEYSCSTSNLAIYLLVIQGIIKTIQHMPFCASDYFIGLVLLYLFSKRKKVV